VYVNGFVDYSAFAFNKKSAIIRGWWQKGCVMLYANKPVALLKKKNILTFTENLNVFL